MPDITFGAWLQRQLTRRQWNQTDFAGRAGISSGRVSDWINDVRAPSAKSCEKIADALGVTLDEVLWRAGHRHEPVDNPEQAALVSLVRRVDLTRNNYGHLLRTMLSEMVADSERPAERK